MDQSQKKLNIIENAHLPIGTWLVLGDKYYSLVNLVRYLHQNPEKFDQKGDIPSINPYSYSMREYHSIIEYTGVKEIHNFPKDLSKFFLGVSRPGPGAYIDGYWFIKESECKHRSFDYTIKPNSITV